ncbi:MAG: DUF3971 domain-containing protein [Nevskia sp.]|nr:DUF3971 domain-containing protein [Nevskia sp.]
MSVPQAALQAQLPQAFEQALPLSLQNAEFAWKRGAAGWQVDAPEFGWQVPGASGHSQLGLLLPQDPGASLRLKLATSFKVADILALKPYLPKTWGPGTRDWLQRALQGGRIDQGQLQIDGPLDDYPFVEHPDGQWLLDLDVADGTLAYAPGWPAVEKLQAQLQFRGHGLQISANAGQIGGNVVDRVEARIPDFRDAKLTVDASTHGEAASYYTALRGSPIARKLGGLLTDTEAAGPVAADVHLDILLNQDDPPVSARGAVHLDGGSVQVRGVARPITDLHGDVAFDDHGVRSENLGGQVYGSALSGTIVGEPESPDGVLEAQLDAPAEPADGVLAAFTPDWLRSRFSGTAHIAGRMPFAGPHSGQLTVKTDLRGVALTLPAPLAKPADEPLPLTVTVGEGGPARPAGEPLRILVDAGERLRVALRFARPADGGDALLLRAAEARLGPGEMPRAEEDGVFVRGAPALFEIGDWIGFIDAIDAAPGTQGTAGVAFRGADLSPQKLAYRGISLLQPHLLVAATAGGWGIQLEGANAQGRVDFARADGGRVEVRLQRLSLEPLAPMSRPGEEEHGEPFEPAQAPVLDFACDALKLGAIDLGRVSFVTARVEDGQALQQLSLKGGKLQGSVHGGWTRGAGGSAADLGFDITSDDLGGVLQAFGYARTMDAKDASFSGKLSWPRQPAGLELAQADGTVTLAVHKGSLRAVEPGATRVLGLLNLYALPRRLLSFDFRDVVAKGLVFDSLTGSFKLAEGQAQTGDLKVDSPSMKMQMTGRIGLAARDYDEKITVQPNVTTGVTVGATLLGGPIAGGIALIAQEVFNKPFSALSQFSYRVTGSWDNPQVKAGDKRQAAATPAPADASEVP